MSLSSMMLSGQSINWLSWEAAVEKTKEEKKKIIVDIYTEWCGWCKKMDQTTFSDPVLVEYINNYYYAVKFDAQSKEPIEFKNKIYKLENSIWRGGYHQLASKITNNQLKKLPTIVFLDEEANLLQAIGGFRNTLEMELMSAYFNGDFHKSTPWKTFVTIYTAGKVQKHNHHDTSTHSHTRMVINKRNE